MFFTTITKGLEGEIKRGNIYFVFYRVSRSLKRLMIGPIKLLGGAIEVMSESQLGNSAGPLSLHIISENTVEATWPPLLDQIVLFIFCDSSF